MLFIYKWWKYFTGERSEQVKHFQHEKVNFISSSQRVMFFLLYRQKHEQKLLIWVGKIGSDVIDILTSEDMENMSLVSWM